MDLLVGAGKPRNGRTVTYGTGPPSGADAVGRGAKEAHRADAPEPFSDPAAEGVAESEIPIVAVVVGRVVLMGLPALVVSSVAPVGGRQAQGSAPPGLGAPP
ncbi:hypothetical protein ACFWWS_16155 [Streptomyces sp. NPDC059083]|uniref:hypothetical protein n=1 Tax=unclassified Streptomyces TaxID=2593676 RepID=UPI00367F801E